MSSTPALHAEMQNTTSRFRGSRGATIVVLLLAALSAGRIVADAGDLTSSGTGGAALRVRCPSCLQPSPRSYAERSGVVNIGVEGMMILGTWFGAWGAWEYGPWVGVVAGIVGGTLGGLLHAVATVTFRVNHIVSGVAINIIGPGLTRFLSETVYDGVPGGGATQSPGSLAWAN